MKIQDPHLFCWYTLLCTWLRIQEQISVNVDCGHMNRETALMRLGLSYRNTSRTRKEKETMWYSSHGCGGALQKTSRHCPLQNGRNMGTLAERHWIGKNWCRVYSVWVLGEEGVKGKKRKENFIFFIPLVAVSVLLSRFPGYHLVSACVLYPDYKSTSQAILCGQWFGEHFLLRKAFGHWVTLCFCESFFFVTVAIIIILIERNFK